MVVMMVMEVVTIVVILLVWRQALYKGAFKHFNAVQTQVFHSLYDTDENMLIAAPPGSGKTVCAELALMRLFLKDPNATAVYIAPLEAIANVRTVAAVASLRQHRLSCVVMSLCGVRDRSATRTGTLSSVVASTRPS